MGFSLKKIFKPAAAIAAGFVANKFLPGSGKFVGKAVSSLMGGGDGAGGNFQIQDTSVAAQNYGGRVGFERSDDASVVRKSLKTVDGEELRNEWDYRLSKWFRNKDQMFT
tara:strand:- start:327 stop:656 length:330 start_codon:yes stop_codon:yes gene_type:complete